MPSMRLFRRNENGSASIEFAFIGSVLIFLTIGVFEIGRVVYTYFNLLNATGDTIRMVGMGAADEEIEAKVRSYFSPGEQMALEVDIEPQEIDGLSYKQIRAQIRLPLIMPSFGLFPGNYVPVNAIQLVPDS